MTNTPKIVPEKIHLQNVRVLNGNIDTDPDFNVKEIDGFETFFEISTGINEKDNVVRLVITVKFVGINENKGSLKAKAEYSVDFLFHIENFKDFIVQEKKSDEIRLHSILGTTLAAISYSTLRGIVLTRLQGTILEGIILPVIDPKDLLSNKFSESEKKKTRIT